MNDSDIPGLQPLGEAALAEEGARAELYGVLAALWLGAPDPALRAAFAHAPTQAPQAGGLLEQPWMDLVHAVRHTPADAAEAEHASLFGGVGRPEIFLYGSHHLSGFLHERPLADLRADLAALGLTRDAARLETEDHVAYGFEVMRWLIAGDDPRVCQLESQRRFFRVHLQSWVPSLCAQVLAHPGARLWARVAALTEAFLDVEAQAFDLLEA